MAQELKQTDETPSKPDKVKLNILTDDDKNMAGLYFIVSIIKCVHCQTMDVLWIHILGHIPNDMIIHVMHRTDKHFITTAI